MRTQHTPRLARNVRRLAGALLLCLVWSQAGLTQTQAPVGSDKALVGGDRPRRLQQEAIKLYRAGQYEQAAKRYRKLLEANPQSVDILRDLMWVLWHAERFPDAAEAAQQLTAIKPDDLEAWNLLGRVQSMLNKKEEAIQAFNASLRMNPEQVSVWRAVAQLYMDLGQFTTASQLLKEVVGRYPAAVEVYPLLGRAQILEGSFAEAAQTWTKARDAFPQSVAYAYQEAAAYFQAGHHDQALMALETLMQKHQGRLNDAGHLQAWRATAQLYMDLEQPARASALLTELLRRHPNAVECYPLLARAQTLEKDYDKAAQAWAKAREAFPDNLIFHYQEVSALQQSGQSTEAWAKLQRLMRKHEKSLADPQQFKVWRAVAQLLLDLERYPEANRVLSQLLQRYPEEARLYPLLARAQLLESKYDSAAKSWAKAREAFPDNLSYRYQEALALSRSGKEDDTLAALESLSQQKTNLRDKQNLRLWRAVVQLYFDLRQYVTGTALLQQLLAYHPDAVELYPLLARGQMLQGQHAEAARSWAKARSAFSENLTYKFQEASAMYQSGQTDRALETLRQLADEHPDFNPAIDLLVSHAIVNQDFKGAIDILERHIADPPTPADEPALMKLANLYIELGNARLYLKTLDKVLKLNPRHGDALMLKAEHMRNTGRLAQAARLYQRIVSLNPSSFIGLVGLADVQYARGRHDEAGRAIAQARELDPNDPYLRLAHSQHLYGQGKYAEGQQLLTDWLNRHRGPTLFALVYHGLTPYPNDPILASPVHMTVEAFEEHMRSLKNANYTAVTASQVDAWYQGTGVLPPKPVLITFDDARLDSFQHADPILERYGFKATMFVPLTNVERQLPGYASWGHIRQYQQTGRWEIQSHGASAARYIPIDAQGREGLFLINRQWLSDEQRLETHDEWVTRINSDYHLARETLTRHIGMPPVALAFPNSNFGQDGIPTATGAARLNLELARQVYGTAYYQDSRGLNTLWDDPILLGRLEPRGSWTGAELVDRAKRHQPVRQMHTVLLRQAAWQGRLREANRWLEALRADGVPSAVLSVEEARIHFAGGDPIKGRALLDRALILDRGPDMQRTVQAARKNDVHWMWTPSGFFLTDNRDRTNVVFQQTLETWAVGPVPIRVNHRSGIYSEAGTDHALAHLARPAVDVTAHGIGLGTRIPMGLFHSFDLNLMGNALTGAQKSAIPTGNGVLRSRWLDGFNTEMEAGQGLVGTGRAMEAGVVDRYVSFRTIWDGEGLWRATAQFRGGSLSDNNERTALRVEAVRRLGFFPAVSVIGRFSVEDTTVLSPNYYSPEQLFQQQIGAEYVRPLWRGLGLALRYLPGYGVEQTHTTQGTTGSTIGRFVQSLEVDLPWNWGSAFQLRPNLYFTKTPTYQSVSAALRLQLKF